MGQSQSKVESPCNDICVLDGEKICIGCFRSLDEIIHWQRMDDEMRLKSLHNAAKRRKTKFSKKNE